MQTQKVIGIDFDNTIVDYDQVCYDLAIEKGLVPTTIPKTKNGVKSYLRSVGKEKEWTQFQGLLYGPGILRAKPFEGVVEFIQQCQEQKIVVFIVSHKTKYPFLGEKYDLHEYARKWVAQNLSLAPEQVFLELTQQDKIERIKKLNCTHFIDDLPEIFEHADFPESVKKILFDPHHMVQEVHNRILVLRNWREIEKYL